MNTLLMNERGGMLDYDWGSHSSATEIFSGDDTSAQNRQFFDLYATQTNFDDAPAHFATADHHTQLFHHPAGHDTQENSHLCSLYDPRAFGVASFQHASHQVIPMLSLEPAAPAGFVVVPKSEPLSGVGVDFAGANLGLNLGGRTYFSSTEDDFVSRLYRRSRAVDAGPFNSPRCQAEGCTADLTLAKHYHRRHKVCEFHSKAASVLAAGLTQRFCQQCSRFHLLTEFDNGKRSCRRRLADHNRRRRKIPQPPNHETQNSSTDSRARSPPARRDSGSSATVAQRSYGYHMENAAALQSSSSSSQMADFGYNS